jgi:hypothetical protein
MWRRLGLVGTDISEKRVASIFRLEGISELGTALAITSNCAVVANTLPISLFLATLKMNTAIYRNVGPSRSHTAPPLTLTLDYQTMCSSVSSSQKDIRRAAPAAVRWGLPACSTHAPCRQLRGFRVRRPNDSSRTTLEDISQQ